MAQAERMYLTGVAGPAIEPIAVSAKPGGQAIGRHQQCDLQLPADADKVSRFHARFFGDDGAWRVADLNSRWGTFLNGVKLPPLTQTPLRDGDLLRIAPWTFRFCASPDHAGVATADDTQQTLVRSLGSADATQLRDDKLKILLDTASSIHESADEKDLANRVLDAARNGTGYQNAIMLRPLAGAGRVDVIAAKLARPGSEITFSRSLITAAEAGNVAELSAGADNVGQSVVSLKISSALCVPITIGPTVAQYLYLDSRGGVNTVRAGAADFALALGRLASLALANLKRIDIERRQALLDYDLRSAAAAQKWILPPRQTQVGRFACVGESRPGQYVGGDFFDVIDLGDNRLAVALGDVAGKGLPASILMTAAQGYLHAALLETADPAKAVSAVNRFIIPRRQAGKFVTMWVGVFDANRNTLSYVDAGHGYGLLQASSGAISGLDTGGGLPVGVEESAVYVTDTVPLPPGGRVVVVSDGIIEQPGFSAQPDGSQANAQFELAGVGRSLAAASADPIADLFAAVFHHAGTDQLADDATAIVVHW